MTLSKTSKAPYNLTAKIVGESLDAFTFNTKMNSCNQSIESDEFQVSPISTHWWAPSDWNWSYPLVNLTFDSQTANLSLTGSFVGSAYSLDEPKLSQAGPDNIYGDIKLSTTPLVVASLTPITRIFFSMIVLRRSGLGLLDLEIIR